MRAEEGHGGERERTAGLVVVVAKGGEGNPLEASPSASEVSGRALRHHQKLLDEQQPSSQQGEQQPSPHNYYTQQ